MKKIVKLFAVTLVCGLFLVGCGGGGGGSSDNGGSPGSNIGDNSFALMKDAFSNFDDYIIDDDIKVENVESYKIYKASMGQMMAFRSILMQRPGEYLIEDDVWLNDDTPHIRAMAGFNFEENEIQLMLVGDSESANEKVIKDSTFNEIFGDVEGNVAYAEIKKEYDTVISDSFDDYAASLERLEFDCVKRPVLDWICTKESDDAVYLWEVQLNGVYIYSIEYK
jgi:hypothetical protein